MFCLLCQAELLSKTQIAKKRLFFEKAAEKYRKILDDLGEENFGRKPSESIPEEQRRSSYICNLCVNSLENWLKFVKKSEDEKNNILKNMECLMQNGNGTEQTSETELERHTPIPTTPMRRKRSHTRRSTLSIAYDKFDKKYVVTSPFTDETIRRVIRKSYTSLSSSLMKSNRIGKKLLSEVVKLIKEEMKHLCSVAHDSILRDICEGVKHFSWETVWLELLHNLPTLMNILAHLVPDDKPVVCLIASMMLKKRLPKIALVQRAISLLLYGNGTNVQVYNCLQPLMVCLSYPGTIKLLDRIAQDHDENVLYWSDSLLPYLRDRPNIEQQATVHYIPEEYDETIDEISNEEEYIHVMSELESDQECDSDSDAHVDHNGDFSDDEVIDDTTDVDIDSTCSIDCGSISGDHNDDTMNGGQSSYVSAQCNRVSCDDDTMNDGQSNGGGCDLTCISCADDAGDHGNAMAEHGTDTSFLQHSDIGNEMVLRWQGFKLVGDNIDKNIHPSFDRIDSYTLSLHYYHYFAALDRIDLSGVSDENTSGICELSKLLPTTDDIKLLKEHFSTLISRILVREMPDFEKDAATVTWHIQHERQSEMAKKSDVVPLGVILLNENKVDHMSLILDELHKYVPTILVHRRNVLPDGEIYEFDEDMMYEILLGGDQLTVTRARSAIAIRKTHDTNKEKLLGLVPVIEDWHARMTLMQVIFKRLLNVSSGRQRGTLTHIKNLIKATVVPTDPKSNLKASEDFFLKVLTSYIVAAAKEIQRVRSTSLTVGELSQYIIDKYVRVLCTPSDTDLSDGVLAYSSELITLGLLWENFHDATREGDGKRIILIWKFLLIVFGASNRTNYRKEAILLLLQYHCLFSKRKAEQLLYSRFINTHGRIGCNIPCDLHLEHLNRRLKIVLRNLQSNIQTASIVRAAKSIGFVHCICEEFEKETSKNKKRSDHHNVPKFKKEVELIVEKLEEFPGVLQTGFPNRAHSSFKFRESLLEKYDEDKVKDKIVEISGKHLLCTGM